MRRLDIIVTPDDRLSGSAGRGSRALAPVEAQPPRPKPRKKPVRWRIEVTPVQKIAALGVLAVAVLMAGAVVWKSGTPQRMVRNAAVNALDGSAQAGFRITEITVSGRRRTPVDQIIGALGARHGEPILGLDIAAARDRLEALPSVRAAAIERRLPGSLHLSIVERQPTALWQSGGAFILVDRDGHQIPGAIEGFEDLPLIVGEGAPQRAEELFTLMGTEPSLASRVKAATRVGNRRWTVRLDDVEKGLEVKLPEQDAVGAWRKLAELEKDRGLTTRQVAQVDLRVPDRLILKGGLQQASGSPDRGKED